MCQMFLLIFCIMRLKAQNGLHPRHHHRRFPSHTLAHIHHATLVQSQSGPVVHKIVLKVAIKGLYMS